MKIFFCASIRGKRGELYQRIVRILKNRARKVFANHILRTNQKKMDAWTPAEKDLYHKRVLENLRKSDVVVAEISYPSMSIGYLIALSVSWQKPTIVLFFGKEAPNILSSLESFGHLRVIEYQDIKEMEQYLKREIDLAIKELDIRFTMLLPPEIVNFLNKVSREKNVPKSVYIRNLIKENMKTKK